MKRPPYPEEPKSGLFSSPLFYIFFGLVFVAFLFFASLMKGTSTEGSVELVIPRGSTLRSVSQLLADQEIVSSPGMFRRVLAITGGAKRVRAGEFRFQKGGWWLDAITALYFQEPIVHPVTIPEGYNVKQIALLLQQSGLAVADRFAALALAPEAAKKYNIKSPTLEGYLFPDTYNISKVDGEERILDRMVQRFLTKLDNDLRNQIRASGMTLEEVVTFASIVEKETGNANERPLVSSVFHNRLKKGMRLQSDPTIIYGITNYDGNIKKKHLSEKTAYNTYVIKGLPPGPIASPGLDAIRATLAPASSNYLYFVGNNRGEHLFSETYEKHSRFVDEYQKRRPNRASASQLAAPARNRR